MLFNSIVFLGFIIVLFIIYPRLRLRGQNVFLLVASYVFYGYWDWRFNFLLLTSTVVNFWVGHRIHASNDQKQRKFLLFISVAVNLSILGFFKYFNKILKFSYIPNALFRISRTLLFNTITRLCKSWGHFLFDTQEGFSYTLSDKKQVLINSSKFYVEVHYDD